MSRPGTAAVDTSPTHQVRAGRDREVHGFAPDKRPAMELPKISKDKRALKVIKKIVGTRIRAKRKREELSNVLEAKKD